MTYKYLLDENSENRQDMILRIREDGVQSYVPNCAENADWQAYQAWLALENEPEQADPLP